MNIATFGKRIWAYIIDMLLAYAIPVVALIFAYVRFSELNQIPVIFVVLGMLFATWFVFTFIYSIWLFASNGRTLGRLIFGLRVVHTDISRLSFSVCLARAATEGCIILIGISAIYTLAVHTEKTVFDRLTNTVVSDWRNRVM